MTYNTGWAAVTDPWAGYDQVLGLQASTFPSFMANHVAAAPTTQAQACGVWLNAGTTVTNLVVNVVSAASASVTFAYLGIYNASLNLVAVTANAAAAFQSTTGWIETPLTSTYTVPYSGLYYLAFIFSAATEPTLTWINGAGSGASQKNPSGQYAYFAGSGTSDSTLVSPAVPTTISQAPWIGIY